MGGRWRTRAGCTLSALTIATMLAVVQTPASAAQPLSVSASGTNAVGRIASPGLPCSDGGAGEYRNYGIETALTPGSFSQLPGTLRATLNVHDDPGIAAKAAFLLGTESHATLANERGSVQLLLATGNGPVTGLCPQPTLTLNGTTVSGSGTWTVGNASGAYRQATGSGTFNLSAELNPGADNVWSLQLNGSLSVLQPSLSVSVDHTYWGNFGLDFVSGTVAVVYRIRNNGPGDAFNAILVQTSSSAAGVTPLGTTPQSLGDLAANGSTLVKVRYKLATGQPCPVATLNLACGFPTTVTVLMPDALDVGAPQPQTVTVITPASPLTAN